MQHLGSARNRRRAGIIGLAVLLLLAAACGGQQPAGQEPPAGPDTSASGGGEPAGTGGTGGGGEGEAPKPLETVKLHVAAKSLTFLPFYLGQAKGLFEDEGLNLDIQIMKPPIGVTALEAGDVDYSATPGVGMRSTITGAPLRTVMFIQTRLSFSLLGQPEITPEQIRTVAVSGLGSTAHYAAITLVERLRDRGARPDQVTYIASNSTGQSYNALIGKSVDAAVLTPPYTTQAAVEGYVNLGDAFDLQDIQGGIVTTAKRIEENPEQVKAMLRATLRSVDYIMDSAHEAEVIDFIKTEFNLEEEVARGSYEILKQVLQADGGVEDEVLRSVVDRMKEDAQVTEDIPLDRIVNLSLLRQVHSEGW